MTTRRTLLASTLAVPALAIAASTAAQEATPAVQPEMGVIYGDIDGTQLLVDIYPPAASDTPQPAVLLFYPGGYGAGERSWMAEQAMALAGAGYVAFTPDYRLLGEDGSNQWPTQLDDAQRAVRWVRANAERYGVDPNKVASYGHSAGAALALHLGARETRDNADPDLADYSSRVACVVEMASLTDLTIPWIDEANPTLGALFLGGTAEEVPDAYADYSVVTHIDADMAPTLILHGSGDSEVPVEHSRRLADVLHENMVEVVYGEFSGIDHRDWTWAPSAPWTLAFLERHLRG